MTHAEKLAEERYPEVDAHFMIRRAAFIAGYNERDKMNFEELKDQLLKSGAKSEYIQAAIVLVRTCLFPSSPNQQP